MFLIFAEEKNRVFVVFPERFVGVFYAFQMEEGARAEELQVQRCRARLDRLATASTGDDAEWEDIRLKRILVDYMLRMSYYDSATKLAEISGIQV